MLAPRPGSPFCARGERGEFVHDQLGDDREVPVACIMPTMSARLVFSQACCRLARIVSRSDWTIALMLSFRSVTSAAQR